MPGKKMRPMFYRWWQKWSIFSAHLNESISGIRVVKAFAQEDREIHRFDRKNDDLFRIGVSADRIWFGFFQTMITDNSSGTFPDELQHPPGAEVSAFPAIRQELIDASLSRPPVASRCRAMSSSAVMAAAAVVAVIKIATETKMRIPIITSLTRNRWIAARTVEDHSTLTDKMPF